MPAFGRGSPLQKYEKGRYREFQRVGVAYLKRGSGCNGEAAVLRRVALLTSTAGCHASLNKNTEPWPPHAGRRIREKLSESSSAGKNIPVRTCKSSYVCMISPVSVRSR